MALSPGKSCLPLASWLVAAMGTVFGAASWILTGDGMAALLLAIVAMLVAVAIPVYFLLPQAMFALGRYIGGRAVGLKPWFVVVGPVSLTFRDGTHQWKWSWKWSPATHCVMLSDGLDDAKRKVTGVNRGGMFGSLFGIALYVSLGTVWMAASDSAWVWAFVFAPILPIIAGVFGASGLTDWRGRNEGYAEFLLAHPRLLWREWRGERPRDWPIDEVSLVEAHAYWGALHLPFTHYNDTMDREALQRIVVRLEAAPEMEWPVSSRIARELRAYWAAAYLRDAAAAKDLLGGDLSVRDPLSWRGAAVLAVLVLEGREEEAVQLRSKVLAMARGEAYEEYVTDHVGRVMRLRASGHDPE